ncbi:unnamed protein product [Rotaria sp. Silwood1]|nr:unnamed protein product [Rotaria sp. Silwood1]CAF1591930.1 unnamed protein product [Rotaria sp. Silwood1]
MDISGSGEWDNGATKPQQQQQQQQSSSSTSEYTGGEYSSQQSNEQRNESYPQHQISTTVTTNRPSMNSYGGSTGQTVNSNGNNQNPSGTNTYKLKQQRNYGSNRYDPLGAQQAGYQARNASQIQGQWNNGVAAAVAAAAQTSYGAFGNPFGLPHHYQQQADMYAGYYGTPQQTSYGPPGTQQAVYGEYGQQVIPPESPKGGHVVYIYGIGQRATQEEIYALFQPFGRVLRVDIIIDFNTGLCKGYAFVAMEQYQEAQMAIQSLNATPFHGRQLQVRFKT